MIPVCTAAQVRARDARVIEGRGIPGRVLMELAGRGAADAVTARWPGAAVAVLCGPGNNGGDGFVIARWLALWGHRVTLWCPRDPATDDAKANAELCRDMGLLPTELPLALEDAGVVVDALLGTGQRSAPRGALLPGVQACMQRHRAGAAVVAVDVPTGLHADTGQPLGDAVVAADLTVTFGYTKPGLLCAPGIQLSGEVVTIDIGLDLAGLCAAPVGQIVEESDVLGWLPNVSAEGAKWDRGHVAVRAGGGAAVMAAHGAFRAGAGLVTLLAPRADWPSLHGLWPEVILAEPDALDPRRHDALVLGPGLGLDRGDEVRRLWETFPGSLVADADALTLLASGGTPGWGGPRVITPHSAEAARLLGSTRRQVDADRFGAVKSLTGWGTALLKGPNTLIAESDGAVWVNPRGGPRLATAGSGDVLAGMIGGLLARGITPREAAAAAAWFHGVAGEGMPVNGTSRDLLEGVCVTQ